MRRSKRIETLDQRPVNLDGYINEWPEMGFVELSCDSRKSGGIS